MTAVSLNDWSDAERSSIRAQLDRILASAPFRQSQRRQRFLRFLVEEALAGRGDRLKAYTVAVEVFERPETFDAAVDPLVRIEAGRLRDKLREYYEGEGRDDPVRIDLPKGSYMPQIEFRTAATPAPESIEPPSAGQHQPRPETAEIYSRRQLRVLSAAALLLVAASLWVFKDRNSAPPLPDKPSIAVLPFDTIGGDARWERLADGMTEDIITDLAHSKALYVIARNSTLVYKGKAKDVRQIGRDLNVGYVLEGSIQAMDARIRVTAQLIEAASGSHVWSERYDRPSADIFTVQNDVTQQIAATLAGYQGAVAEAERSRLRRKPPANLTAFDTYLLAIEAKHKVTKESLAEAERLFSKALELDPQLARAHVGLADTYYYLIDLGLAPSVEEAVAKMKAAGEKAVELDPNDGKTHFALGLAYTYQGKPEQALVEFDRALTLAPSDADLLLCIAWTIPGFGQSERAVALAERSLKLNPHYPDWYNQGLSYIFYFAEQYERSAKHRLLVKQPLALDYAYLAMAYAKLGRMGDAEAAAASAKSMNPSWTAERYLSEAGGFSEREGELLVDGARMAGLTACVPADEVGDVPNLIRVKSCDEQRTGTAQALGR
ncbi:MAG: tetratricopeptide repeat protein [Hyphomicrobium sp.]